MAGKPWIIAGPPITFAGAGGADHQDRRPILHSDVAVGAYEPRPGQQSDLRLQPGPGGRAVVQISSSDNRIDNTEILGGSGTAWPLRFAGGQAKASPTNPTYATGNSVNGLVLHDEAPRRADGFDFSFQEDATISNVRHIGSRRAVRRSKRDGDQLQLQPQPGDPEWDLRRITSPRPATTSRSATSPATGRGAPSTAATDRVIGQDNSRNITIDHEAMTAPGSLISATSQSGDTQQLFNRWSPWMPKSCLGRHDRKQQLYRNEAHLSRGRFDLAGHPRRYRGALEGRIRHWCPDFPFGRRVAAAPVAVVEGAA